MTKNILIVALLILNVIVGFLTYRSVKDDIDYANKVYEIDLQVIERLQEVQRAQLAFRDMKGYFANDFDTLFSFFRNEKYMKIRSIGDLDSDSSGGLRIDTVYLNPIVEFFGEGFPIERIAFVPPMDTAKFLMESKFIDKNNIQVPVFEVTDPYPFNKKRALKVGSLTDAVYSGNWK
jgi:hypothetical protein